jgi:phosphoserine phosphatase RsbU/P
LTQDTRERPQPLNDFEELFENAPCGLISTDMDGWILRANLTLADWLEREPADFIGKQFQDLMSLGGKLFYETHCVPLLRIQGSFSGVALELVCKNEQKLPVLMNAVERRDSVGESFFVQIAIFNASERRRYERNLLDARTAAEAAVLEERTFSEFREQFIAVLGHDLRNPLASLASGLRMLGKEQFSERSRKIVDLMDGSILRASTLIDNVMDFARARLGTGIGITPDPDTAIAPVIEQVVAEMRSIDRDRAIETHIDIQEPVEADRGRIGQLVSNLLGNALTHGAANQPVRLTAVSNSGILEISVSNGGEPIPQAAMDHLFKPFVRGTVRPNQQGLGLGLYIASEIAKAHGGTIDVTSRETETRFTLKMPTSQTTSHRA